MVRSISRWLPAATWLVLSVGCQSTGGGVDGVDDTATTDTGGEGDTGADDSDDTGSDDTGSDDTGMDDTGTDDTGDLDADGDGFEVPTDCDDTDALVNPGASEVPYDGVDNDCSAATVDDDLDGDGYALAADCNDDDADINPGVSEVPADSIDNDCNPATLDGDADSDGYDGGVDCDDTDASVNPGAVEVEGDGVDNDCNTATRDVPFVGGTMVAAAGAIIGGEGVAIGPNGNIYAMWTDDADDVWVAASVDGGVTFGPATKVDGDEEPLITPGARRPYITADADRVAVVINDSAGDISVFLSSAGPTLSFGSPQLAGTNVSSGFKDFAKPAFGADGKLSVAFQAYPTTGARIFIARETDGFDATSGSDLAPGVPCECCPLDVMVDPAGELSVAFRNNDSNTREMWVAHAPNGSDFTVAAAVSSTEGIVPVCPMEGPRLASLGGDDRIAVWSSRGSFTGSATVSFSDDGGRTWTGDKAITGMADERAPTIAVGPSGRVYVATRTFGSTTRLLTSDDGGDSWGSPTNFGTPSGTQLVQPELAGTGMGVVGVGVTSGGEVWLWRWE